MLANYSLFRATASVARWYTYFETKKFQFGQILEGLAMEDVGIEHGHFVYFTANWYILWTFGTLCGHLVYFYPFWYVVPR
jgi:ABC-type spermidine/putrescine transport system permease subunit II